jgi:arylsulfatase A-like enzyme
MTSDSGRSPGLLGRGVVIAACAGACTGLADVVRALAARRELVQPRDALLVVAFYVAWFAPCGIVAALVARAFDLRQRALHLLVVFGAAFFFFGAWMNVELLPGFTSGLSLAADAALLGATALWFRRRYRDTALDGMRVRPWIVAGGASVVAAAAAALVMPSRDDGPAPAATAAPGAERPNVLLYLCDTLRADHLGCYGYGRPTSPEIDEFAKDATVFEDCRAVTSWTKPSVASMFTSLYPTIHGCIEQREVLAPEAETVAEVFRAAGWRTAAFVDNPFVTPEFGFGQGFESFRCVRPSVVASGTLLGKALFMVSTQLPVGDAVRRLCGLGAEDRRSCADLNAAMLEATAGAPAEPWFAYLHAMEPHLKDARYEPSRADAEALGFPAGEPFIGPPPYNGILPFQRSPAPPPETLQRIVTEYDACIRGFSREFGRLIAELRRRGDLERTIVVFVADHGEEFHEHGGWTHGHSLHREVTQVPLIVRLPDCLGAAAKASRGRRVGGVATLLDVFPTLVDLASVRYPRGEERRCGLSLRPELLPPSGRAETAVPPRVLLGEMTMETVGIRSIREDGWQLIVAHEPLGERAELYRDGSDPRHGHDKYEAEALVAGELRTKMNEKFGVLEKARLAGGERELDPETLARLKSLGYAGGR